MTHVRLDLDIIQMQLLTMFGDRISTT